VVHRAIALPPDIDSELDRGEREAIALAQESRPDVLLLIDETRGREEAERHHIQTTGTLGVLDAAAGAGLRLLDGDLRRRRAGK
jgi:predicted nucleic acid-binding protein